MRVSGCVVRSLLALGLLSLLAPPAAAISNDGRRGLRQTATPVRLCIPSPATPAILTACTQAVSSASTAGLAFSCVDGGSPETCMDQIAKGSAELTSFGAAEVYTAKTEYSLEPILAELYNNSTSATEYYSVAIVPKEFCDAAPSLQALKGKRSCHTGYRKTAGWVVPVGSLVDADILPVVNTEAGVQADAQSVAGFFSKVCAPRVTSDGPAQGGTQYAPLCTACGSDCGETSPYYDYAGTFRGLVEGICDVAFTKQDIVPIYASDGSQPATWATKPQADFRLLCPGAGGCQTVDQFQNCNLGRVPSHAIVGPASMQTSQLGKDIKAAITAAADSPAFLQAATEVGELSNFIFAEGTTGVVAQNQAFDDFFDPELSASFSGVKKLEDSATTPVLTPSAPAAPAQAGAYKMCIPLSDGSDAAFLQACNTAMALADDSSLGVSFTCVAGDSATGCMEMVKNGQAQLTKFGPSDVYLANRDYGLEPIVSEFYGGEAGSEYYSVGVVKKEFCDAADVTLRSLHGKRSCHTGYRKTAGWFMPVGFLAESKVMPIVNDDVGVNADAETVAAFFSKTCAPRVTSDGPAVGGTKWEPLCTACGDDCSETSPYYDYSGTVRGLMEGTCDVAFTKQDTVPTVAKDGSAPESWSSLNQGDFRLVCPNGGCAAVSEFRSCNFARVPSQAIVGSVEIQRTAEGANVKKALVGAVARNPNFLKSAIQINGAESFLFTKNTKDLNYVNGSFLDYFGTGTLNAYKGLESMEEAPPTSSGGGLSTGAIVGIVVGVLAAGIIAGVVGLIVYKRTRAKYAVFDVDVSKPIPVGIDSAIKL